jgi:GNAT superfamily N-acetyltransferase
MFDRLDTTAEMTPHAIRRLQHGDADRVAAFVAALDQDTLQLRFGRFMSAAAIHAHYAGLDWNAAVLLAWDYGAEPGSQIGGVVEVYLYQDPAGTRPDACEAEIPLVVGQGLRGRGVGRLLLSSGIRGRGTAWRRPIAPIALGRGPRPGPDAGAARLHGRRGGRSGRVCPPGRHRWP